MQVTRAEMHERARRSFFREPDADPRAVRVCRGTSCLLAGADTAGADARGVYCLGYCDRAPAALHPDGRVECAGELDASVRCTASAPVVSERIAVGDFSSLVHARGAGVYAALEEARRGSPGEVIDALSASGERGRGGAGFPTGEK